MTLFVDTSAIYALADRNDRNHAAAARAFPEMRGRRLRTHNYVLVESLALIQRRLGAEAAIRTSGGILELLEVEWVGEELHRYGLAAFVAASSRSVSFVDQVSFALMRRERIAGAFAFDSDFEAAGFELEPDAASEESGATRRER